MNILSKLFKNTKRIEYKNQDSLNHYTSNPYTYKLDYGFNCFLKKDQNFDKAIIELYKCVKNDLKN